MKHAGKSRHFPEEPNWMQDIAKAKKEVWVLLCSRRCECHCVVSGVRKALIPYIVLNEKKIVLTFLCEMRELCCPLAAVTALCLERPKPPFQLHELLPYWCKRMELRWFCTSCCLNQIQIPCIWNGSWVIFRVVSEGLRKRMFLNSSCSLD
jgi:hypothetical protein